MHLWHLFLLLTAFPLQAIACACCAEPGHRVTYSSKVDDWHVSQLSAIALAPKAFLYSDACGDDCILGITDPKRNYDVTVDRTGNTWRLRLSNDGTLEGQLHLELPDMYQQFSTDLAPTAGTTMPAPYTEVRHKVSLKGDGAFQTSQPVAADLIFAGQSQGMCEALQGATHWFLDVRTDTTRWRLFGDLIPAP